ncbi:MULTISPECIES: hypothetical protein [Roseomonas]|uniref:hypothetical protein n=1 Tax=Roseomonas TaxID=125216 RepID=UPI000F80584C|nr:MULTISPECIES: hypothetical protein [Roseomonas]
MLTDSGEWPVAVSKSAVYEAYLREAQKTGKRALNQQMFGQQLSKLCDFRTCKVTIKVWTDTDAGREEGAKEVNGYRLPELEDCRRQFEARTRQAIDWEPIAPTDENGAEAF